MKEKQHRHFILHKPYGYLSQFVRRESNRKNKKLLGELYDFPLGVMSIGRLDEPSEGLLFLTTDGKVSEKIRSRKYEKEYYVQVDGEITEDSIEKLRKGVEIGIDGKKYMTLPCDARILEDPKFPERSRRVRDDRHGPSTWISVTLREGKFRQVRKMTASVGFPTLRLVRFRIGSIQMSAYEPGKVEEVDGFFD